MKSVLWRYLVVSGISLSATVPAIAQPRMEALAIDAQQGDQYGCAVDYETTAAARAAALRGCGAGCSVVLTFDRCGAYAADQDADSTAAGWAQSYVSAAEAREAVLAECGSRGGGSGCVVRVWRLQRPGGRRRVGPGPSDTAPDSAGPGVGGVHPRAGGVFLNNHGLCVPAVGVSSCVPGVVRSVGPGAASAGLIPARPGGFASPTCRLPAFRLFSDPGSERRQRW